MPLPLEENGIWKLDELGLASPLMHRSAPASLLPSWLNYPLTFVALLSAAVIVTQALQILRHERARPTGLFLLYGLIHGGLIMIAWLFHDRYYLVLLPALVIIIMPQELPRKRLAVISISVLLLVSLRHLGRCPTQARHVQSLSLAARSGRSDRIY
jgi:hypothetical protein